MGSGCVSQDGTAPRLMGVRCLRLLVAVVCLSAAASASFVATTSQTFSHRLIIAEGPPCSAYNRDVAIPLGCEFPDEITEVGKDQMRLKCKAAIDTAMNACYRANLEIPDGVEPTEQDTRDCMAMIHDEVYDNVVCAQTVMDNMEREGKPPGPLPIRDRISFFENLFVRSHQLSEVAGARDSVKNVMLRFLGNFQGTGFALVDLEGRVFASSTSIGGAVVTAKTVVPFREAGLYGMYGVVNDAKYQYTESIEEFQHYAMHPYCSRVALRAALYLNRAMEFGQGSGIKSTLGNIFGTSDKSMWKVSPQNMMTRNVRKKESGVCWAWANPAQKLQAKLHMTYAPGYEVKEGKTLRRYSVYTDPTVHPDALEILNAYRPVLDTMPWLCNFRREAILNTRKDHVAHEHLENFPESKFASIGMRNGAELTRLIDLAELGYDAGNAESDSQRLSFNKILGMAGWTCDPKFWDEGPASSRDSLTCDCNCGIWDVDCGTGKTDKNVYCHQPRIEGDEFVRPNKKSKPATGGTYTAQTCTLASLRIWWSEKRFAPITGGFHDHPDYHEYIRDSFQPVCSSQALYSPCGGAQGMAPHEEDRVSDDCDPATRFGGCAPFYCSSFPVPKPHD